MKKCFTGLNDEEVATSKSRSALSQKVSLRRIRRNQLGDEVVANEVSEVVIPNNQRYTIVREDQEYDEGEPFYFEDSQLESPFRVIVFTTARNLNIGRYRENKQKVIKWKKTTFDIKSWNVRDHVQNNQESWYGSINPTISKGFPIII